MGSYGILRLGSSVMMYFFFTCILFGCGSTSPKVITQGYIDSLKSQNYRKAWNNIASDSQAEIAGYSEKNGFDSFKKKNEELMKDEQMKTQLMSSKAMNEKIEGNNAIVTVQFTGEQGTTAAQDIRLVKESGKWKIQF